MLINNFMKIIKYYIRKLFTLFIALTLLCSFNLLKDGEKKLP